MIDLHAHTTASDGRSTPEELVRRATAAGITTLAVTDHDTMAGVKAAADAAKTTGLAIVPGIEITAVHEGKDVHMLGYFLDADDAELSSFLVTQRADRRRRIEDMLTRLASLGIVLDRDALMRQADGTGKAIGRPVIARALIDGGHVRDMSEAFDRYLSPDRPAFVARQGAAPADVAALIVRAGGVASLAHPGKLPSDDLIPALATAGLDAVEVFHPDHDRDATRHYQETAARLGLLVSGGSDDHGPGGERRETLGSISLPPDAFAQLTARAAARRRR